MSESAEAILDAAERRIRQAGYSGFSFREIAADVGIKSSSVHYHFPTKEQLAAAVARRYTERFQAAVSAECSTGTPAADAWTLVFRRALIEDGRMCLCGAMGAAARDLPEGVLVEVRRFFESGVEMLMAAGLDRAEALHLFSTLEGAMLLAFALDNTGAFDMATASR